MQAKIRKDGDVTVVELQGRLDFETAEPFRETCQDLLLNNKVVFNLADLNFVGSSGIGAFVNTLKDFAKANPVPPRFCNVKSEFMKIFTSGGDISLHIFDDEEKALSSFENNH
jgi:anti-sigma B factor antagonist